MIEDAFSDNFTLFVLAVSIVLSFVLRRLIDEIQLIKESYSKDLILFTEKIVEEHPSLEHFYQLALLFYKNKNYTKTDEYLKKLIGEGVFEREAKFYLILTLVELGKQEEAKNYFSSLDLSLYSKREVLELKKSLIKTRNILELKEWLLNVLLTRVPLQLSYSKDLSFSKEIKIIAALPTRYTKTTLKFQNIDSYIFETKDQHLNRNVELWVFKSEDLNKDENIFLELPKTLANLHSRSFPEVYDLQQGSLVFYSKEKFEGDHFFEYINKLETKKKFAECFSLWISLFTQLEFLYLNQLTLKKMDYTQIGFHSRKECIFIFQSLVIYEEEASLGILSKIQESFILYIQKLLEKFSLDFEVIEMFLRSFEFNHCSLKESIHLIENLLQEYLKESRLDINDLLKQLDLLEEIHRSCIHGLKGKFSVYQRYLYDQKKLLKTFFRDLNIDDVNVKMKYLVKKKEDLMSLPKLQVFSLTEEILAVDFEKVLLKMFQYKNELGSLDGDKNAEFFLQTQSSFFTKLSNSCSKFLKDHEYDLEEGILSFIKSNTEKDNIDISIDSQLISKKIRVVHKAQFEKEIYLLFENAVNNSFEAGSKSVSFFLLKKSSQEIRLEIIDDGPGISENILKELNQGFSHGLSIGGTGLMAMKNSCNIIGAQLELKNLEESGFSLSIDLPSFRN